MDNQTFEGEPEPQKSTNRGGARPGAGRKSNAEKSGLQEILSTAWPRARRVRTIKRLAESAEEGDTKAAGLLLGYAYGRPVQPVEHDLDNRITDLMALLVAA